MLYNTVSKTSWNWLLLHVARPSSRPSTARTGAEHWLDVLVSAVYGQPVLLSSSPTLLSVFVALASTVVLTLLVLLQSRWTGRPLSGYHHHVRSLFEMLLHEVLTSDRFVLLIVSIPASLVACEHIGRRPLLVG